MFGFILSRAIEEYKKNFIVCISFAVLFLFAIVFALPFFSEQFFVSSGTVFLAFNYSWASIIGLIIGIIFLYIFSFFISLIIYSVHRDVQTFSIDTYWTTLMKERASKIFVLYFVLAIIFYAVTSAGLAFGFSSLALLVCFIVSLALMYVPQSIVLDELPIIQSILKSLDFWAKNFVTSIAIVVVSSILLFVIVGIELFLELATGGLVGSVVSFILILLFLVPFNEQMKSYAFVLKYALIRSPEVLQAKARKHVRKSSAIPSAVRLREKARGGKL